MLKLYGIKKNGLGQVVYHITIRARDLDDCISIPNPKTVGTDDAAQRNQKSKRIHSLFTYIVCGLCYRIENDNSAENSVREIAKDIRLELGGQREIFVLPGMIGSAKNLPEFVGTHNEGGEEFGYFEFADLPALNGADGGHRTSALIRAGQSFKFAKKNGAWPKASYLVFSPNYSSRALNQNSGEFELVRQLERHFNMLQTDWLVVSECNVNDARQLFYDVNANTSKPSNTYESIPLFSVPIT